MGIKNFYKFIEKKSPNSITKIKNLKELNKIHNITKIGLDASNVMYKFLASTQTYSKSKNKIRIQRSKKTGLKTSHVIGMIYRSLNLLESGIHPFWVFDGSPIEMKREELNERKKSKEYYQEVKEDLIEKGEIEEALKYSKRTLNLEEGEVNIAIEGLNLLGIQTFRANFEADHLLTKMFKDGVVDAVMSDDADLLIYGIQKLVKTQNKLKKSETNEKFEYEIYDLDSIKKSLNWEQKNLIDFGILNGTDYNKNPNNVGAMTAFKLINKYQDLEKIIEFEGDKFDFSCLSHFEQIRMNFLKGSENEEEINPQTFDVNFDYFKEFMQGELNFSKKRVDNVIKRMENIVKN